MVCLHGNGSNYIAVQQTHIGASGYFSDVHHLMRYYIHTYHYVLLCELATAWNKYIHTYTHIYIYIYICNSHTNTHTSQYTHIYRYTSIFLQHNDKWWEGFCFGSVSLVQHSSRFPLLSGVVMHQVSTQSQTPDLQWSVSGVQQNGAEPVFRGSDNAVP